MSASSPVAFPWSSGLKRNSPHDHGTSDPNPSSTVCRIRGPFVDEFDEDDDEDDIQREPPSKKRVLSSLTADDIPVDPGVNPPKSSEPNESRLQKLANNHGEDATRAAVTGLDGNNPNNAPQIDEPLDATKTMGHSWLTERPLFSSAFLRYPESSTGYVVKTCGGKMATLARRQPMGEISYESMVAARSRTKEGRAKRSYYGIDIHDLIGAAAKQRVDQVPGSLPRSQQQSLPSIEGDAGKQSAKRLLWTEKYRARNFVDLCGDDGTNRLVLRWLKKWDPIVFPGLARSRPVVVGRPGSKQHIEEERPHRKVLLLTGPPGLGKTTLAHVCAKQAGYDIMEINASDDRSRDVVKSRIRTSLGTESVKNVSNTKSAKGTMKTAKPVCVIVDEVDGAVTGSGASGEGGFVKALADLVLTDQKNSQDGKNQSHSRRKKGDDFRLMRPLILICNDIYHPALRPLRQSNLAEIIHVGRPSIDSVVTRLKTVFEREAIPCDKDAARKLCETAWGISSGIDAKRGAQSTVEGDLRGVMVVGEWVAGRFRSSCGAGTERLSRHWIDQNIMHDLASGAAGSRGLGRGGVKDIVSRLFREGGGFPKQAMDLSESKTKHEQPRAELGFGEQQKKYSMDRLRQMVDTSGEISQIVTEIFAEYPEREFNDDSYLTKPNQAYDWLHFHDTCQSRLFASQEWELAPYLAQPVLACHHLFASPAKPQMGTGHDRRWGAAIDEDTIPLPFSGRRADYQAHEAQKQNRAQLQEIQSNLSPTLMRSFRSAEEVATEFLPYLIRMVSPNVKPVVVGGSQGSTASVRKEGEREMVKRASEVLAEVGVVLQKGKVEGDGPAGRGAEFVYRMDPDLDGLSAFETGASLLLPSQAPTRFAVRQVLDQELQRTIAFRENQARQSRFRARPGDRPLQEEPQHLHVKENASSGVTDLKGAAIVKKDFFGRIVEVGQPLSEIDGNSAERRARRLSRKMVYVTYNEGLNNAVRKPISLSEFLGAL